MANGRCTETHAGLHWVAGLPALVPYSGKAVMKNRKIYQPVCKPKWFSVDGEGRAPFLFLFHETDEMTKQTNLVWATVALEI
jgi:hypothetical protein